ncbi:hypothetical protein NliqN6_2437 [Naganishia liquefaciens]|uniref:Aminopeptidase P family protein n=1 Tax=Naganishia liquefaciens TaxID=104408 RepID=A0A8H3YE09_9TREE|nr:hypothetical protein NliqN6_2437 [Naganishia liquefaciens]
MPFCLPFLRSSRNPLAFEDNAWTRAPEKEPPCRFINHQGVVLRKEESRNRLESLRALMQENKIEYYVIPSEDEHQSEFTTEADQRRKWITGFTGSAGTAIVGRDKAWLFVDSRYWLQAPKQISDDWTLVKLVGKDSEGCHSWHEWCEQNITDSRVGIDPKLITLVLVNMIETKWTAPNVSLVQINKNLIDVIRPPVARSLSPVLHYPLKFSGCSTADKLSLIRNKLFADNPDRGVYILPVLPSIAWLLNLRCRDDVPNTPIFRSYVTLTRTSCRLYADRRKISSEVEKSLAQDGVKVLPYGVEHVKDYIVDWKRAEGGQGLKVLAPPTVSWGLVHQIKMATSEKIDIITCPVEAAKAVKNATEIQGFRNAYLRDGAATVRWMAWLDEQIKNHGRKIGEWEAGEKLTEFRSHEQFYAGLAYENISGSGPNGALPHYSPQKGHDRVISTDAPYVIDAGAQYLDGTIDTTRTLHFGKPTPDHKRAFTRVLQGHIAVETTPFPKGTRGDSLEALARQYLFADGLNFGHGVGHGIGSYLSVHEGPQGIPSVVPFEPGHLISNEPGFYLEGQWGIRTESVIICKPVKTRYDFGGTWLGWERITRVPIQTSLVDFELLSSEQKTWLKKHNETCRDDLMPLLTKKGDEAVRKWLKRSCI